MTTYTLPKVSEGLSPSEFTAKMTKNQSAFRDWFERFTWPDDETQLFFERFQNTGVHCKIIAADWCGDVVRNVPVILRLTEAAGIPTTLYIMEEHLSFIDQFLTMGGRSIPVVLFVNDQDDVIGRWGPRPTYIQEPMVAFKETNLDKNAPDYEDNLKAARQELMRRYGEGTDYQTLIVEEIQSLLKDLA